MYDSEYATHDSVYATEKSVRGTEKIVYATHETIRVVFTEKQGDYIGFGPCCQLLSGYRAPVGRPALWQGKKASNPRPTVLETAALPAELFPYI